jgi:hypothetical protein
MLPPVPTPSNVATPWSTSAPSLPKPVGAWPFSGNGEASVGDVDVEFLGGTTATPHGVAFDGLTGVALTDGPSPVGSTESLTMSAWVSHTGQFVVIPMVLAQGSDTNLAIGFGIAGSEWIFGTSDFDLPGMAAGGAIILGPPPVQSDEWLFLTGVQDREEETISFYMNGELVDEVSALEPFESSGPLIIGGQDRDDLPASGVEPGGWAGAIANVAVYESALTSQQVTELYGSTRPTGPPPQWTPDPQSYADGMLDGVWEYKLTDAEASDLEFALGQSFGIGVDDVSVRLGFDGPTWWQGFALDGEPLLVNGSTEAATGIFDTDGDELTTNAAQAVSSFQWHVSQATLTLDWLRRCDIWSGTCVTPVNLVPAATTEQLVMDHVFAKTAM